MKRATEISAFLILAGRVQGLLDADAITKKYFGNDAPWYRNRIPFFESSDQQITDVYYYRWNIFRAHQRDLGALGFISTEFLDDVGWQEKPWASLNDATGFHLQEGRWCRDRRFKEDYISFTYSGNGDPRHFSESMAAASWATYLVDGVASDATSRLDGMQKVFNAWQDHFDSSKGLYWVEPLLDATEYTISSIDASGAKDGFTGGDAFRPSINAYQYANAKAIANIAALKGGMDSTVDSFQTQAAAIKARVQKDLWNSTFEHFTDRFYVSNEFVKYWDFIRGRELVGMVPWTHNLPDDTPEFAQAWKHILDSAQLAGEHGLRTVEPSYPYYMRQYRYEGTQPECQWNGPIWPFQTTQVLDGLANFLDHYPKGAASGVITSADYTRLLEQYAQLHYNPERGGILDLEEDYYPDTGSPIVGLKRSLHYFHSGYIDLILSGLVGIRPSADDKLEVNPLAADISYFRAENILYHGHDIAVQWDATGSRYGTAGLQVFVDGKMLASSPTLTRLSVPMTRIAPNPISRPIAKSIKLSIDTPFPAASVSVPNADSTALYGSIDGRVWFFPETEVANGWTSPKGNGSEIWFEIDLGQDVTSSSAELAFFANEGQGIDVPEKYRVQTQDGGDKWVDVQGAEYGDAVANGITEVTWSEVGSRKVRLVFVPKSGLGVRIVEMKVF